MNRYHFLFALLTAVWAISGCGRSTSDKPAENAAVPTVDSAPITDAATDSGIIWYAGGIDAAFAYAKAENKPIFLYWGAEWCPPCHAINATVFKSKAFIDRSRSFVAVYLDGDTPNAQEVGESFGVLGYPTMIVFDPAGNEVTRIPGGIDIQAYANVLDLALDDVAPAADILSRVINKGETLVDTDCRLLAYYSWDQDLSILAEYDAAAVFNQLEAACPEDLITEKTILYFGQLNHMIDAAMDEENPLPLTQAQKTQALGRLDAILADYALVKANALIVALAGADITAALTEAGTKERQRLRRKFVVALEQLFNDNDVYMRERLYTLVGKIRFERMDNEESDISESLRKEIKVRVAWADEATPDPYERHPIINAAANLLDEAGMNDVARPLLLNEIKHAKQPYYFMTTLADIEQAAGEFDAAINWHKQAYDTSTGPATRFEWGYYFVVGLIEMTPEDTEAIQAATVKLIRELELSGGFHNRPKAQLKRLESKLREWNEDDKYTEVLTGIREEVQMICASSSDEDASHSPCETFLEAA